VVHLGTDLLDGASEPLRASLALHGEQPSKQLDDAFTPVGAAPPRVTVSRGSMGSTCNGATSCAIGASKSFLSASWNAAPSWEDSLASRCASLFPPGRPSQPPEHRSTDPQHQEISTALQSGTHFAFATHETYGFVASFSPSIPRHLADWYLKSEQFDSVPGEPGLYRLSDPQRDGHRRTRQTVHDLRRKGYVIDADPTLDPTVTADRQGLVTPSEPHERRTGPPGPPRAERHKVPSGPSPRRRSHGLFRPSPTARQRST
jgi:hypothetical protein